MLPSARPCVCHSDLVGKSPTRAASVIWFVGAALVGAVAAGLHLLRSQILGAHQGVTLTLSAFGLTALAAVMLFHGVVLAARAQDAAAGPDPLELDDSLDEAEDADDLDDFDLDEFGRVEPAADAREPAVDRAVPVDAPDDARPEPAGHQAAATVEDPERDDAQARDGDTAYDPSAGDGPAVYTFRRGKPVPEPTPRADRPPRRDRPA